MEQPIRIAIIGTGGFAAAHHGAVQTLEETGAFQLVATCDPNPALLSAAEERWSLARRGVATYSDYTVMLDAHAGDLEIVTVPTPIPLHAAMHRACVVRGIACYLEKPPTLDGAELDAMLAVETDARRATQVGYNVIVEAPRQALKRRLVAGEFGAVRRAGFVGVWPRSVAYFQRNDWAGRLLKDGRLVLDSCLGNALAHHVHNVHFWAGTDALFSWEPAATVQAELYRAHAIEGFDTGFLRAVCPNGVELRIAATHAADGGSYQREWVECERATLTYITGGHGGWEVRWADGRGTESGPAAAGVLLAENLRAYGAYVRGSAERPLTRLADSRPFVEINDLAYLACGQITDTARVPGATTHSRTATGEELIALTGVREAVEAFAATGALPSQQGGIAWARPGGAATRADLPRLREVVEGLAGPHPLPAADALPLSRLR